MGGRIDAGAAAQGLNQGNVVADRARVEDTRGLTVNTVPPRERNPEEVRTAEEAQAFGVGGVVNTQA